MLPKTVHWLPARAGRFTLQCLKVSSGVQVRKEMEAYRLYAVVPFLVSFIEQLTNIYVRYNRKRLKGGRGEEDGEMALATLFDTLLKVRFGYRRTAKFCSSRAKLLGVQGVFVGYLVPAAIKSVLQ